MDVQKGMMVIGNLLVFKCIYDYGHDFHWLYLTNDWHTYALFPWNFSGLQYAFPKGTRKCHSQWAPKVCVQPFWRLGPFDLGRLFCCAVFG